MAAPDIRFLSIAEVGALLRQREITSTEVTQACLDLIDSIDSKLHAFILVTTDLALAQAAAADADFAKGVDRGPLQGIPVALKDLYATKGIATTAHSRVLIDSIPEEDGAAAESFQNAGAVLMGKLAMDEFAFGVYDENVPFPPARNPWNLDHVPGGSSSGSGVAVAAGLCFGALGSDTGGSIRFPAAHCGIVGIKPTFGRVSRRGVVPLSWSLDHAGPLTRGVEDCALVLQTISGFDPADPASANVAVPDFAADLKAGIRGLRLGVPRDWFNEGDGTAPEVVAAFESALETLTQLGAVLVDLPGEPFIDARPANSIISISEAFAYHEETLRTRPQDFTRNVRNRIREGAFVSSSDYVQAQRARVALRAEIGEILDGVDAVVSPTAAATAERFDSQDAPGRFRKPSFANPANLAGFPSISVPCGLSEAGLPMGLQFTGRAFDEVMMFRLARAYEGASNWSAAHPAV